MKNIWKRAGALFLTLALTLGLACCAGDGTQNETTAGGDLSYGLSNPWDSLMPYYSLSGSNYSRIIYDKIYDRLAYIQADGTCLPRAAKSWESADEGRAIVFALDEKAAFHDGTPVTAQHWVETIQWMTDPASGVLGQGSFACLTGTNEQGAQASGETLGVEALDDHSLKLSFKTTVVPEEFLVEYNRDLYVLPTHLLQDIPIEELVKDEFWLKPVGSGPCKFVSEVAGSSLVLEANKDYQLGAPGFDTMTITVMDKANLLTALISGDLDYYAFGANVSEENRPTAEAAGFTVVEDSVPSTFYELMLNNSSLGTPALRQAVNAALDKELLCQQSTGSLGTATNSSILPDTPYSPQPFGSYDPARAEELVREGGYSGKQLTLACTSPRASIAALIQQDLEAVGFQVEIQTVDSSTLFAGMSDGLYDMAIASHTPNSLPLWFTGSRFHVDNNIFHIQDLSRYTQLVSAIQAETQEDARQTLVAELEAYLGEEMPFVPLWFSNSLRVQSKTVEGIDYPASASCNENVWAWTMTGQN